MAAGYHRRRRAVLIGYTGTGKSHLAVAIARACIRAPGVASNDAVDRVRRPNAVIRPAPSNPSHLAFR
jgi:hypothetical protein